MAMKTAKFRLELDLVPHLDGKEIVVYGICYDGSLAVLATDPAARERMFAPWRLMANIERETSQDAELVVYSDSVRTTADGEQMIQDEETPTSAYGKAI